MRMALLRRIGPWLWPPLLMAVIFFFSAQSSLDSGLGWIDFVGRKLVHFAEYGLLCFLWWRALRTRMASERAALVAFVISSLYAATDELHQSLVDGRHASAVDWAIDSAGAALVALRLRAVARRRAAA